MIIKWIQRKPFIEHSFGIEIHWVYRMLVVILNKLHCCQRSETKLKKEDVCDVLFITDKEIGPIQWAWMSLSWKSEAVTEKGLWIGQKYWYKITFAAVRVGWNWHWMLLSETLIDLPIKIKEWVCGEFPIFSPQMLNNIK